MSIKRAILGVIGTGLVASATFYGLNTENTVEGFAIPNFQQRLEYLEEQRQDVVCDQLHSDTRDEFFTFNELLATLRVVEKQYELEPPEAAAKLIEVVQSNCTKYLDPIGMLTEYAWERGNK